MKTKMMLGLKLFKQDEDNTTHMIRIVKVKESNTDEYTTFTIKDYDNNEIRKINAKDLSEEYKILEPDAIFTVSNVIIKDNEGKDNKDVIVTANKYLFTKMKELPFVVCRQSAHDVFADLFTQNENGVSNIVGLSMNKEDCPAGFDFRVMLAADEIIDHVFINFYRNDVLKDILDLIPFKATYDNTLNLLYKEHCKIKDPKLLFKHEDEGWCDNLTLLLELNNFQTDLDRMLNITALDFEIEPYIEYKPIPGNESESYGYLRDDIRYWLSSIYKINIKEANILEYDHDINLADYNNVPYFLFRDSKNKLYLVVYIVEGEYLESDLEAKEKEYDFSTKFRINFYNKYNTNNDNIIQN